jgi:hypothetical protein
VSSVRVPHPKNAPGGFYIENECCMTCGVMHEVAGDLFAWDERKDGSSHCYVRRQPQNWSELLLMLKAMETSELSCVRYGGNDDVTIRLLLQERWGAQLDPQTPSEAGFPVRNCVTFTANSPTRKAEQVVAEFQTYLRRRYTNAVKSASVDDTSVCAFTPPLQRGSTIGFAYTCRARRSPPHS